MRFVWVFLLAMGMMVPLARAEVRDAGAHFFQPKLGDLPGDLVTAKQEGKAGILLMFEMDDCPFCQRMKATVLNQSEVQDWFRAHFILYAMDTRGDTVLTDFQGNSTTEKAFALTQRARATPTFIFYDLQGQAVARFTGATQNGEEFLKLGRYVLEGHYKTMSFNAYKRQSQ